MKKKKVLGLFLSLALVVSAMTGCSPKKEEVKESTPASTEESKAVEESKTSEAEEPAEEEVALSGKITFSVWDFTSADYLGKLVDAFETVYPDVEVEVIDTPSADYTTKLSVDLNGGAGADVFLIKDGDSSYSLNGKGQLADLTEFINRDGIDLSSFNGLADYFAFDGTQAGLPFRTDYYLLYYNKAIFDEAGVAYPSNDMTWEEFEETAKLLTSGSGNDKVYGAHFHTWQALVENWAVQDSKNTIMGPDYEHFRPFYEMVLRMQNDDKTIQDYGTLKAGNIAYGSAFQSGNVAMMPMGSWFSANMIQKINAGETDVTEWGVATIPHAEGVQAGYTVGSTTPIAINEASANKEIAWEFVKFLTTSEEGTQILAQAGQIPGAVNSDLLEFITSQPGMPEGALEAMNVENITLDRPYVEYVSEVNQMLGEEHALVMLGEVTVDDFIETINARSAEIQNK
ncbi:sugar ABC transporter substrate-binding protein [Lachnospiraceae bacterium OttesenSCG-928-D06]|nr:sugar ABC transporter substrate-binding protein [Lachnospiraceae bacterium OttesenSCG-928-D06]